MDEDQSGQGLGIRFDRGRSQIGKGSNEIRMGIKIDGDRIQN